MAHDLLRSDVRFVGTEKNLGVHAGQALSKERSLSFRAMFFQVRDCWFPFGHFSGFRGLSSGSSLPLLLESVSEFLLFLLEKREWNHFFPARRENCILLPMPRLRVSQHGIS